MQANASIVEVKMKVKNIKISNIPSTVWGEKSDKLIIAVHGNMSSKADTTIKVLAEEAVSLEYQVLSFDLPEHGDRKSEPTLCKVDNCVSDLKNVMEYAKSNWSTISLMANSMGAYFSLLAYKDENIKQSMFLSPVVDMERIIKNMMGWFHITEQMLFKENEIATPIGQTLYWDYFEYVKNNPVEKWNIPTSILYGKKDELCEYQFVSSFCKKFSCDLEISLSSEHYFHTEEDIKIYRKWIRAKLIK